MVGVFIAFIILAVIGLVGLFNALFANVDAAPTIPPYTYEAIMENEDLRVPIPQNFSEMELL